MYAIGSTLLYKQYLYLMSNFNMNSNNELDDPELPVPDIGAVDHSQKVCERLKQEIKNQDGMISFKRFMEIAMYEPGLGYYSTGAFKFGKHGDFVTAPELSTVYSYCIAKQCQQILKDLEKGRILELGPGTGRMACDILLALEKYESLPDKYFLLEPSADLRVRQQEYIKQQIPHLEKIINWLDEIPDSAFEGIILANEVLDAMPVCRFVYSNNKIKELNVGIENNRFVWLESPFDNETFQIVNRELEPFLDTWPQGYTSEINTDIQSFINSFSDFIKQGAIIIADYGYPRQDYYHPQRINGTLLCHYRHRVHNDPFFYPGLQDITSSVNFTRLAEAAVNAGLDVHGYTTQAHFLISCGLEEVIKQLEDGNLLDNARLSSQIRQLTMPGEMGERFKFIALSKNMNVPLLGFEFVDLRAKL